MPYLYKNLDTHDPNMAHHLYLSRLNSKFHGAPRLTSNLVRQRVINSGFAGNPGHLADTCNGYFERQFSYDGLR